MNHISTKIKIALLQLRDENDPMGIHETDCFVRHCKVQPNQIIPFNVIVNSPDKNILKNCDIIMLGGSGDYSIVGNNIPWYNPLADFMCEAIDKNVPIFGSCMGIQVIANALGGEVILDNKHREVGTYSITLNEEGHQDPLFSKLPKTFLAQMGHKCRVSILPENAVSLASSDLCSVHAFKLKNKMVYATQFHPELNYNDNVKRLKYYYQNYHHVSQDESLEEMLMKFKEDDTNSTLLSDFIKLVTG